MSVTFNLLVAIVALSVFLLCLIRKSKFGYYIGFASMLAYLHTSTNVIESLFSVHWIYVLLGHVCIFVLIYLASRLLRKKSAKTEEWHSKI